LPLLLLPLLLQVALHVICAPSTPLVWEAQLLMVQPTGNALHALEQLAAPPPSK
jgi:hypothetical protein